MEKRLTSVAIDLSSAPVALGHNRAIRSYRISLSTDMLYSHELQRGRVSPSSPLAVNLQDMCPSIIVR